MQHLRHIAAGLVAGLVFGAPVATAQTVPPVKAAEFGTYDQCVSYPALKQFQWARATVEAYCADEFTPVLTRRDMRKMIEAGEGRKLDKLLDGILLDYRTGKLPEGTAWYAHARFNRADDDIGALIARWLEQSPGSAHALAARGIHRVARGADARGTTAYREVPSENIARMERELKLAKADLLKAVKANPRILRAWGALIDAERISGSHEAGLSALKQALREDPKNFYVRSEFMSMLDPRWGGSFEEMDEFARSAEPWLKENPRLATLRAWALTQRGFTNYQDGKYAVALPQFESGLAEAPMGRDLFLAGVSAYRLGRHEYAVELFSQRLRFVPYDAEVRTWRANAYGELGKLDEAQVDLDVALEDSPNYLFALREYAHLLMLKKDYKSAAEKLEAARKVDATDLWVTRNLAWIYVYRKRNLKEAEPLVAELLANDPKNGGAWLMRADILQDLKRPGLREAAENFVRYVNLKDEDQRLALPKVKAWLAANPAG